MFLCTGNSCRSQMAEGFLHSYAKGEIEVQSAGIKANGLNPRAVKVMQESGIDISVYQSKIVDDFIDEHFDFVITVCDNASENCPFFPGEFTRLHQGFEDPALAEGTEEEIMTVFRRVRDEISEYCTGFVAEHMPWTMRALLHFHSLRSYCQRLGSGHRLNIY